MKNFLTVFSNVTFSAILISGCFALESKQDYENTDFGNSTYVWDDWTPSTNVYEWTTDTWNLEPAIP